MQNKYRKTMYEKRKMQNKYRKDHLFTGIGPPNFVNIL